MRSVAVKHERNSNKSNGKSAEITNGRIVAIEIWSIPIPCGASRTAFPNWWVATELFNSITSIYLLDMIESGLALLFL